MAGEHFCYWKVERNSSYCAEFCCVFQVSEQRGTVQLKHVDVNPGFAGEFNFFSPTKLFATRDGTITDVQFFVAGVAEPATKN